MMFFDPLSHILTGDSSRIVNDFSVVYACVYVCVCVCVCVCLPACMLPGGVGEFGTAHNFKSFLDGLNFVTHV